MTTDINPEREPYAASEFDRQMRKENSSLSAQNDAFRVHTCANGSSVALDHFVITAGVLALGNAYIERAVVCMRYYSDFTEDNDPWGEHDFGRFELDDQTLLWKIDYYDTELEMGSPDPRDPAQTRRVLTLMLAKEY